MLREKKYLPTPGVEPLPIDQVDQKTTLLTPRLSPVDIMMVEIYQPNILPVLIRAWSFRQASILLARKTKSANQLKLTKSQF